MEFKLLPSNILKFLILTMFFNNNCNSVKNKVNRDQMTNELAYIKYRVQNFNSVQGISIFHAEIKMNEKCCQFAFKFCKRIPFFS